MAKTMFYDRFNEKAIEFFSDLTSTFPEITEFKRLKTGLTMMSNLEQKSPERIFRQYVLNKFKEQILKKDEAFFLNHTDYEIHSNKKEYWTDFMNQIKSIWSTLDDSTKEVIWKYFHILLVLSDKCSSDA